MSGDPDTGVWRDALQESNGAEKDAAVHAATTRLTGTARRDLEGLERQLVEVQGLGSGACAAGGAGRVFAANPESIALSFAFGAAGAARARVAGISALRASVTVAMVFFMDSTKPSRCRAARPITSTSSSSSSAGIRRCGEGAVGVLAVGACRHVDRASSWSQRARITVSSTSRAAPTVPNAASRSFSRAASSVTAPAASVRSWAGTSSSRRPCTATAAEPRNLFLHVAYKPSDAPERGLMMPAMRHMTEADAAVLWRWLKAVATETMPAYSPK